MLIASAVGSFFATNRNAGFAMTSPWLEEAIEIVARPSTLFVLRRDLSTDSKVPSLKKHRAPPGSRCCFKHLAIQLSNRLFRVVIPQGIPTFYILTWIQIVIPQGIPIVLRPYMGVKIVTHTLLFRPNDPLSGSVMRS